MSIQNCINIAHNMAKYWEITYLRMNIIDVFLQ